MITFNNAQPWRQQYQFNTEQSAPITGWQSTTYASVGLPDPGTTTIYPLVTKEKLFLFFVPTSGSTNIYKADIQVDGTLGSFSLHDTVAIADNSSNIMPSFLTLNRFFIWDATAMRYFDIDADGNLGPMQSHVETLANRSGSAFAIKNSIAVVGSILNGSTTRYGAANYLDSDGHLIASSNAFFNTSYPDPGDLPVALSGNSVITTNNRIYSIAGVLSTNSIQKKVYTGAVNENGESPGTYTDIANDIPAIKYAMGSVVTQGRVYLIGGIATGFVGPADVYSAPLDANGVIGTWSTDESIPFIGNNNPATIITNSRIFLFPRFSSTNFCSAPFAGGSNNYLDKTYSGELAFWTNFKGQTELG